MNKPTKTIEICLNQLNKDQKIILLNQVIIKYQNNI